MGRVNCSRTNLCSQIIKIELSPSPKTFQNHKIETNLSSPQRKLLTFQASRIRSLSGREDGHVGPLPLQRIRILISGFFSIAHSYCLCKYHPVEVVGFNVTPTFAVNNKLSFVSNLDTSESFCQHL